MRYDLPIRMLTLVAAGASLACAADSTFMLSAVANISFQAHATLHDFEGDVEPQQFVVTAAPQTESGDTLLSGSVEIPVSEITTHHEGRDRNMRAMFEAERHPALTATFERRSLRRLRPGDDGGRLTVELTIRDITAPVDLRIVGWDETDTSIDFSAEYQVSLERYDLKPPSPLPFVIRVKDTIQLNAGVHFRRNVKAD